MESCHRVSPPHGPAGGGVALVGHHNVGKSTLFQQLTGRYVAVANYPGTTVELARGMVRALPGMALLDTPGVVMLPPRTEDEQVTASVLLNEPLNAIVQVGDAKNVRRTLLLTVQLAELGVPLVLALNMTDEADARGVSVNHHALAERLGLPVVRTVAIRGQGIDDLTSALKAAPIPQLHLRYDAAIEQALSELCPHLSATPIAPRALALLWLSGDPIAAQWLNQHLEGAVLEALAERQAALRRSLAEPLPAAIQRARLAYVEQVAAAAIRDSGGQGRRLADALGRLAIQPLWGGLLLALILYALYWFVGVFGAGTLVGLLEERLFGAIINPWLTEQIARLAPAPLLADALVGEYGLWTMGMTYALALVLPIVTTFFLAFGVMEDSGYLPRLTVLSNRVFRLIGLNGKAVLPMVLGLGCVTMATMTTRILESKRDRLLVTLLLALAVPCSAQLGVVLGMLAGISFGATLIWLGIMGGVLLTVGWLAARLVPGERSTLLVELPPLRWPAFSNVLIKTLARLEWYLKEVVPMFLLGTALLFLLDKIGILPWLIHAGEPLVVGWLGLPAETSAAFLLGFMRRDFGATGLFVLASQGLLTPRQVLVSMVTITLFIPCVASIFMIAKERGRRTALAMTALIFPLAFLVGGLLQRVLLAIGWGT
jgi:ferrous iron transport protein B